MGDDLQVTLAGAQRAIAADDIGAPGAERLAQLIELLGMVYDGSILVGPSVPRLDPSSRMHTFSDGLRKRFKDDFSGNALDNTKWTSQLFGGGTLAVSGSLLTLSTGDAASGSGVELLSADTYDAPARLLALVTQISQRIANQEFSIELVEETTVFGATGTDGVKLLFNGTSTSTQQITTLCNGDQDGPNNWTGQATANAMTVKYELDLMPDECWIYDTSTFNSTGGRSHYAHQDRKTPDPSKRYRIRLRLRNTAAAASATTVSLDAVILEDNSYIPVEIAHGRGSAIGGEELPVAVTSAATTAVYEKAIWYDETSAALGASATFTGTSRDLTTVATGSTVTGYPGAFRALAIQNVAGTLYIEVSADGSTWYRAFGPFTLAQGDGTMLYSAVAEVPQIARYARAVLVNGGGAATTTRVFTKTSALPGS